MATQAERPPKIASSPSVALLSSKSYRENSSDKRVSKLSLPPATIKTQIWIWSLWFVIQSISIGNFCIAIIKPQYRTLQNNTFWSPTLLQALSTNVARIADASLGGLIYIVLHQYIRRKAATGRGILIDDLAFPQTLLSPGECVSEPSRLFRTIRRPAGILILVTIITQWFYTTAVDTLVSPKLQWVDLGRQTQSHTVQNVYGNLSYINNLCQSLIPAD